MSHRSSMSRALGPVGVALLVAACSSSASVDPSSPSTQASNASTSARVIGRQQLSGHLTDAMRAAPSVERMAASTPMTLTIGVRSRDAGALAAAADAVSDPQSPEFRHYLTPAEFGDRFGASSADYAAVVEWAKANNLTVEEHPNRLTVVVHGQSSDIESALHVELHYALRDDGTRFHRVDREPSLDLDVPVQYISNLEDFAPPRHASGGGSGPGGSRQGKDFRNAYAAGSGLDGSGQTVGIFMFDNFSQSDLVAYAQASGLPTPPTVTVNGSTNSTTAAVEGNLDVQMVFSMAPAAQITVFGGDATTILTNMTKQPQIKQLTSSWFWGNTTASFNQQVALQQELALQGQSFFQATGDNGSYTPRNGPGATDERESPYLTLVGGTALTMSGASWAGETAWDGSSGGILSNGGVAPVAIPSYQVGLANAANQASSAYRNAPDVSAEGSDVNIYVNGAGYQVGGTSAATPLWAGFMALVNEQAASYGLGSVGFANPALYAVASSSKYASTFHDVSSGSCPCNLDTATCNLNGAKADYAATSGYDLCTGLGSPQAALINAIASVHASKASPALAALNGTLHATYISADSSNTLLHIASSDGVNWTNETPVAGHASSAAPALAAFNGQLHMAYIANNSSNQLLEISSTNGVTWGTEQLITGRQSKASPSLAAFNGKMYMAYLANNTSNELLLDSSTDGVTWGSEIAFAGRASLAAPSLAVFNGRLYVSYVSNNASGALLLMSTADGVTWTNEYVAQVGRAARGTPTLAVEGNTLYLVYLANNARGDVMTLPTTDGVNFGSERPIGRQSSEAPAAIGFNGALRLAYIANNTSDVILRSSSTDGLNWGAQTAW